MAGKRAVNAHLSPSDEGKSEKEKRGRFRIHPLFLLVGAIYACTGELFVFFLSTLVALEHECAHAFAAARLGYRLNEVVLMPYGAVIDGDMEGISFGGETYVAVCGPLCNALTALFFVALWWLFPVTYPYTDIACYASVWTAAVNLLPAYPLDGGRVLFALIAKRAGEKKARTICRAVTVVTAACLVVSFVVLLRRGEFQFGLLTFSLFVFFGAFGNGSGGKYQKIDFSAKKAMERGVELKTVALLASCPVVKALSFCERGKFLVVEVYDEKEEKIASFDQNELAELFGKGKFGSKIGDFL